MLWPLATTAAAIDSAPDTAAEETRAANSSSLPSVVVTARFKKEREIETPISMTVLDGENLSDSHISEARDLPEKVAGLTVVVPNPRLTTLGIRGLSSNAYNDGLESSVGLFVDGVYMGKQGFSIFDLVDIDRIEVLRGPQGTLFGKNTTAGALLIHTREPSETYESTLEASVGNYLSRQMRGTVSGPLADEELSGRLTGYLTLRNGMIENRTNGELQNDRDRKGLRGQLLWKPSDDLKGRFIFEYGGIDERCCSYPLVAPQRAVVLARDEYMEYWRPSLNAYDRIADGDEPLHVNVRQLGASAEWVWTLSPRQQVTSITAWRDWQFQPQTGDNTALRLVTGGTTNGQSQFTQELRLASRFESFDLTTGLFLMHQDTGGREDAYLHDQLSDWVFGGLIRQQAPFATQSNTGAALHVLIPVETLNGMTIRTPYSQKLDSAAAFGSMDWHLTPQWDLTVGLRYSKEWKSAIVSRTRTGGNPSASPLSLTDNLAPLGALIGQDLSGYTFKGLLDSVAGGDYARSNDYSEGDLSGQMALTYKLDPEHTLYASVARGYKSGGVNLGVTGNSVKPIFKPETATSYEVGSKNTFFNRRVSLSAAVYHTDIKDYQAFTFDDEQTLLPNPRMNNLLNVGAVTLDGVEIESTSLLFYGLFAHLGLAYNRAITGDFKNAPDEDTRTNTKDLSGQQLYNAPLWSGNVALEQMLPLADRFQGAVALEYSYRTETYGTVERGRATYIDAYGLANARFSLIDIDRVWQVTLWARNLLDKDYIATVQPLYGVGDYGAFAGDPRTVGMTMRFDFR